MPSLKFEYRPGTLASQRPSSMVFSPRLLSLAEQVAAGREAEARAEAEATQAAKEAVKGVSAVEAATSALEKAEPIPEPEG